MDEMKPIDVNELELVAKAHADAKDCMKMVKDFVKVVLEANSVLLPEDQIDCLVGGCCYLVTGAMISGMRDISGGSVK